MTIYYHTDQDKIEHLLVGRRIVEAEMGTFPTPGFSWRGAEGRLVLDDGTVLFLAGNDGGCVCGAGDYPLAKVAKVDNVITNAWVEQNPDCDDSPGDGVYRIFVFADGVETAVAEFAGSDGNGYYGTGFMLSVVKGDQ